MSPTAITKASKAKPTSTSSQKENPQAQCQCPDIRQLIARRKHAQPFDKNLLAKVDAFLASCGKPGCRSADFDFRELLYYGWTKEEADDAYLKTMAEMLDLLLSNTA